MVANIEAADRRTGSLASNDPDHPGTAPTITVVTSRCTPESGWRPSDAEYAELPIAARPALLSGQSGDLLARVAALHQGMQAERVLGGNNLMVRFSVENYLALLAIGAVHKSTYDDGRRLYRTPDDAGIDAWMITPPHEHHADADCAPFLVDDECVACGVVHTHPCTDCGGRGYHASPTCEVG